MSSSAGDSQASQFPAPPSTGVPLRGVLAFVLTLGVTGLGFFLYQTLAVRGPRLQLESPVEDGRTLGRKVLVSGAVQGVGTLTLSVNGERIPLLRVDQSDRWTFSHSLTLSPGPNNLLFLASDEGGGETRLLRRIESLDGVLVEVWPEAGSVTSATTTEVRGRLLPAMPGRVRVGDLAGSLGEDGRFLLSGIPLREGKNTLRIEAQPEGEDALVKVVPITVDRTPPQLRLGWPRDGATTLRDSVRVEGYVEDPHLASLQINGRTVPVSGGTFRTEFELLHTGVHTLRIEARDTLGHATVRVRRVERVDRLDVQAPALDGNWRRVAERATSSLVLLAVRLEGRTRDGRTVALHRFGTGFFASSGGHIVASKRLIQPWKFRPLADRLAQDKIAVIDSSYQLHAWPVGTAFRKADGSLDLKHAWSTRRGTLEVVRTGFDSWEPHVPARATGARYVWVHKERSKRNDEDLAVLRARLSGPITPARLLARGDRAGFRDEVLVVGFAVRKTMLLAVPTHTRARIRSSRGKITLAAEPLGGHLGGPLLNRYGRVVGISTQLVQGRELLDQGIHVEHIRKLLYGGGW